MNMHTLAIKQASAIRELCSRLQCTPTHFFVAIWSVVLHQFTGNEALHFMTETLEDSGTGPWTTLEVSVTPDAHLTDLIQSTQKGIEKGKLTDMLRSANHGVWTAMAGDTDPSAMKQQSSRLETWLVIDAIKSYTISIQLHCQHTTFEDYQARRMGSTFMRAIEQILAQPQQKLKDINLFNPEDMGSVLQWSHRKGLVLPDNPPSSVVDVIRQQVEQQPDKIAIHAWDGELTYRELDDTTTHVASILQIHGVRSGSLVLTCFEKTKWAVIAQISVLKTGAGFVPMEYSHPVHWWNSVIQQVKPVLILTSKNLQEQISSMAITDPPVMALCSDTLFAHSTITSHCYSCPQISPSSPAYVLFTSGSTGKPKGCLIENHALASVDTLFSCLYIHRNSRVLQFAPYTFALSIIEVFNALAAGATICIPSDHDRINNMEGAINDMAVSWALLTPSAANVLDGPAAVPSLKMLAFAGEPILQRHIDKWADGLDLHEIYGFSEAAGSTTISPRITRQIGPQKTSPGFRPTTATTWLVDPANHSTLAPVGAIGELLVQGPLMARGYLNDKERTDAVFIPAPKWLPASHPLRDERMYKTGDLMQFLEDGSMRFWGRKDTQAKIRGKRLELGAVEYAAEQLVSGTNRIIAEVVTPVDGHGGILAVFLHYNSETTTSSPLSPEQVFARGGSKIVADAAILRSQLPDTLLEHMVPSVYVELSACPVTTSGKVDRRKLRLAAGSLSRGELEAYGREETPLVCPVTPQEFLLHDLYAEALEIDGASFGVQHSFLRLGGDSIQAMRLARRCRESRLNIDLAGIMRELTIANLAAMLNSENSPNKSRQEVGNTNDESLQQDNITADENQLHAAGISNKDIEGINRCSPFQRQYMGKMRNLEAGQIRIVWKITSRHVDVPICATRLQRAWRDLTRLHAILRTVFVASVNPKSAGLQVTLAEGAMVDIVPFNGSSIPDHPFFAQPLFSLPEAVIYHSKTGVTMMSFRIYHGAIDASSMSVITRDLGQLYDGVDLTSMARVQYPQYANILAQQESSLGIQHWARYLEDLTPCMVQDCPLPGGPALWQTVHLDLGCPSQYQAFTRSTGITLATLLELAWSLVLRNHTGSDDVSFAYATLLRDEKVPGIEAAVGPFMSLPVCRTRFTPHQTVLEALNRIQSDYITNLSYPHVRYADALESLGLPTRAMNTAFTFPPAFDDARGSSIKIDRLLCHNPSTIVIRIDVTADADAVCADFGYWSHELSTGLIHGFRDAFSAAIKLMVSNPQQQINDISRPMQS